MKKLFAIALLFVSGSCVTFFHKQKQVLDCCKAPSIKQYQGQEWKAWDNKVVSSKNWQCQCPCAKQNCGKNWQWQAPCAKVVQDSGKHLQCQTPCAKAIVTESVKQCQSPCAIKGTVTDSVKQCQSPCDKSPKQNWQCQCPCGKKDVVVNQGKNLQFQNKQCQLPFKK